jgi:hypothetical protein
MFECSVLGTRRRLARIRGTCSAESIRSPKTRTSRPFGGNFTTWTSTGRSIEAQLAALLEQSGPARTPATPKLTLPPGEKIGLFRRLFTGRQDEIDRELRQQCSGNRGKAPRTGRFPEWIGKLFAAERVRNDGIATDDLPRIAVGVDRDHRFCDAAVLMLACGCSEKPVDAFISA